ncbi:hypothetical protein LN458_05195 [Xanthomonas arboricola]|uniref:hypothetical protein n=1 Tax=Xanthomonas arboricola TaxID=56448 RepID=UPI001E5CA88D|nr:hypothetical protein [Xanthomonas arboricola]MCC8473389.1 hypothetical protein [Xanthomonas arboricola]
MDGYWFTSNLFTVELGEDEEGNPGRYGRQLAIWLKAQLEQRGYNVEPVIAEDWGRCLMLSRHPFLLWVGCGNVDYSAADDPTSDKITWHCFPAAEVPFFKRIFCKPDTSVALSKLDADLRAILITEPAVTLVAEP